MAGAIVLVVVLVLFPVIVGLGSTLIAATLGHVLWKDGEARHEGSELIDLNT